MCKRCLKSIQLAPKTMLFHQYFLRAINLELYQLLFCSAWVAVAGSRPLLGGWMGACGGSLDWDWAGWGLGWALMGSGWGLGDDWASPPTPVEPCDRTQPGPPKFQTITNPPLGFYLHWNLWPWSPHPFHFSRAAALYLHMGQTDRRTEKFTVSFIQRDRRGNARIWSDILQLACVQPPTSSYNL